MVWTWVLSSTCNHQQTLKKIPESSTSKAYILSSKDREGGLESLGHVLLGVLLYGVLQVIGVICNSPGLQQLQM
jgi:hypothetical protein